MRVEELSDRDWLRSTARAMWMSRLQRSADVGAGGGRDGDENRNEGDGEDGGRIQLSDGVGAPGDGAALSEDVAVAR